MKLEYKYYEYDVEYYSDIKSLNDFIKKRILNHLDWVNQKTNTKLSYGIFDPNLSENQRFLLLDKMLVSLIFLNHEPVAFSYQYFLDLSVNNKPVLHQGLIVSYKNPGRDITMMNKISCKLLYENIGDFYTTCLAAAPFAIGEVSRFFSNTWPSPYAKEQKKPSEEYKMIAKECFDKYVIPFFPFPETLELDLKRFVLISKSQEMGFEVDLRKMQRDNELIVNLFSMFWLNYERQEVLLQVGIYNNQANVAFTEHLDAINVKL